MAGVPSDQAYTNFRVGQVATFNKLTANQARIDRLTIPGGLPGDVLINNGSGAASWSPMPQVIATINAGVTPTGMAITSDSKTLYVANNNNYGVTTGDYITVVNAATNMPITNIYSNTFNQPYTATLSTDESLLYITNSYGTTISIIDTATNTVVDTIGGLDGPSGLAIKGTTGYVNNYGAGMTSGSGTTISVVDLTNGNITDTIIVDQAPAALALSPDGTLLYVACYTTGETGLGTVNVVSTVSNTVVDTITGFSGPFGIAVHPNGLTAYVTNFGSNNFDPYGTTVSVVDLVGNTIVATVEMGGIQPSGVAVTPNGKFVYISNYNTLYSVGTPTFLLAPPGQGTVNVISTESNQLVPVTIAVGQSPANIVISPNGKTVYVSNFTSGTVSAIKAFQ